MTTAQTGPAFETRRSWFAGLLDRLLDPPKGNVTRLDPRRVSPHLLRDMGFEPEAVYEAAEGDWRRLDAALARALVGLEPVAPPRAR